MTKVRSNSKIALLRGVNVGGVKVRMAPLRELAAGMGWSNVKTYIASGNLVFTADGATKELAGALREAVAKEIGVDTPIMVLTANDMLSVLDDHPWTPEKGNQSHVYFCWDEPQIDEALYQELKSPNEELLVIGGHLHFFAPDGLGQSQLADKFAKIIRGTEMTGRNLNTVRKLADMAVSCQPASDA